MPELKIWMNGKLVPQAEAVLPVNSAAVFYATNVFEGLRAYWNESDEELYSFRLDEHFTRLRESMKMMRFTVPYSDADLKAAVHQVLAGNEVREDIHMHLVAYVVGAGMEATSPTGLYINPRRRGRMTEEGLRCCVSSWARTNDNAIPIRLKCGANYQNGRLALLQAKADGYDAPIFLNQQGKVAEGTGATFFMVRKGKLVTPPITSDILEIDHAHHPHRVHLPRHAGHRGRRAGDRPDGAIRGRGGLLLRQRLRDHTDRLHRPLPARHGPGRARHPEAPQRIHEHRAGHGQALPGMAHARLRDGSPVSPRALQSSLLDMSGPRSRNMAVRTSCLPSVHGGKRVRLRRRVMAERLMREVVSDAHSSGPRAVLVVLLALAMLLPALPARLHAQAPEADVFVARAIVAYEEKRYQDALDDLNEALRLDPGNIDALYYTGLVNIALQRFDAAAEALERARKERPGDLSVLFQLGVLYFGMGRYDEAQPLLEEVFKIDPGLDGLGYYVGFMRYRQKDYQGALRAFRATQDD